MAQSDPMQPGGQSPIQKVCDRQTLDQLINGNTQAFFRVVNAFESPLFGFLLQWVNDRHQAQDILQEVFLRLHRSTQAGSITRKTNLRAYLFTIARNCVIDHYRSDESHQRKLTAYASSPTRDESPNPHDTLATRELAQLAQTCLQQLPLDQREVITLQVHSGLKLREIAEVLGIPLGTVKSRIRMGLNKLHQQLNQQEASHV